MRKVLVLVIGVVCALSAYYDIEWEKTIPFESEDDGPVSIDIDMNGDIYVACYTDGPNESTWEADTLSHAPKAKVIRLDSGGNIIEETHFGTLFNNGIKAVHGTDSVYTLYGRSATFYRDEFVAGLLKDVLIINYSNSEYDTLAHYNSTDFYALYDIGKVRYFDYSHRSTYEIEISSQVPGGHHYSRIIDNKNELLFDGYSINYPDTLSRSNFPGTPQINDVYDFEVSLSPFVDYVFSIAIAGQMFDAIIFGYSRPYIYEKGLYESDYLLEKYYYLTNYSAYPCPESQLPMKVNCITYGYKYGLFAGVWIDNNRNSLKDDYENYIVSYDSDGIKDISDALERPVDYIYTIGENDLIFGQKGSPAITQISYGLDIRDTEEFYTAVLRPVMGTMKGFISAGVKDNNIIIQKVDIPTGIEDTGIPVTTELHQNYPNPFNPSTEISYSLKSEGLVTLSVFNTKGELVSMLVNEKKMAGNHSINFSGEGLNSGIYFYKLSVDGKAVQSRKMMLLK